MKNNIKFCRGCGHTPIAKVVEEFMQERRGIFCGSVGCSASLPSDFEGFDTVSCAHGRALAVATGIRRAIGLEKTILAYQGDGDALTIGMLEFKAACYRNEKIICVLVDNFVFAMTGFQLSALTPLELKTKTSLDGRIEDIYGIPVNVKHEVSCNPKCKYYLTTSATKEGINLFKQYLHESVDYNGFSVIHVISPCVTSPFFGNAREAYDYSKKHYEEVRAESRRNDPRRDIKEYREEYRETPRIKQYQSLGSEQVTALRKWLNRLQL